MARRAQTLLAAVLLCSLSSVPGSSGPPCEELPQDTTALVLQRNGPEVIIIEYNVSTGKPTGLSKRIKRQWSALAGFAVDSQQQKAHFLARAPLDNTCSANCRDGYSIHSFALGSDTMLAADAEGMELRSSANASISNLWNVAPWESMGSLIAVAPSVTGVFNTTVLAVNASDGAVKVLAELEGSPVQGIHAMDSVRGRYFFLMMQVHRRALVVYHVDEGTYETVGFSHVSDVVGLSYDRQGCQLLAVVARAHGILEVLAVELSGRDISRGKVLTHLGSVTAFSGSASYHLVGLTAMLRVGTELSMLYRGPKVKGLTMFNLARKAHMNFDVDGSAIAGVAIRTQWRSSITRVEPGYVGVWGRSTGVVTGVAFGLRDPSPVLYVGSTRASSSSWISDSAISFKLPAIPHWQGPGHASSLVDPWQTADGYVYRKNWVSFVGEVQQAPAHQQTTRLDACHPSYEEGTVCAYAGTAREMYCRELSVGFVCARLYAGRKEPLNLDVQLAVRGKWLDSNLSVDVAQTWYALEPMRGSIDGGELITLAGGPFAQNDGAFSCRFGGLVVGVATYFNESVVTCQVPRWRGLPGFTSIELVQGGFVIASDSRAHFLFTHGAVTQIALLAAPIRTIAQQEIRFDLELQDQDGTRAGDRDYNVSVQLEPTALVRASASQLSDQIEGTTRKLAVAGAVSFSFAVWRAGTYRIVFSLEPCCVAANTTFEVLVGVAVETIQVSVGSPKLGLAGVPMLPDVQVEVLNAEQRLSNQQVQVWARLDGVGAQAGAVGPLRASAVWSTDGIARFTDLTIMPSGNHTVVFSLTGNHSGIEARHNVSIFPSRPRQLFNGGSRPHGTHASMKPLSPPPKVWVLDAAGNRIYASYWTQSSNGTLKEHLLNARIRAELSYANPLSDATSPGSLFGGVAIVLRGEEAVSTGSGSGPGSGSTGSALSGSGSTTSGSGSAGDALPWCQASPGSQCGMPRVRHLCGGGDVCGSDLGLWNETARRCRCFDPETMRYSVTQHGGQAANFSELIIDTQGKGYLIRFTSEGLLPAQSLLFAIVPGSPSRLHIVSLAWFHDAVSESLGVPNLPSAPPWAAAGAGLSSAPVLALKDAGQNLVPGPYVGAALNVSVSLVDAPPGVVLSGTLVRKIYRGFATFTDLVVDRPSLENAYRLKFHSPSDETSDVVLPAYSVPFQVEHGPPRVLDIVQQPGAASGGTPMRLQPGFRILDGASNLVRRAQGRVTAQLQPAGAELLLGHVEAAIVDGEALFTDLTINSNATNYTLSFTAHLDKVEMPDGIDGHEWYAASTLVALSEKFEVMTGRAVRMVIFQQPGQAYGGEIVPQPILLFVDNGGNTVGEDRMVVSVDARQIEMGAQVLCRLGHYSSDAGAIHFTDLNLCQSGQSFQLIFTINVTSSERWAGRESVIESQEFDNTYGQLQNLSIVVQPDNVASGAHFSQSIQVVLVDKGGNVVPKTGVQVQVDVDTSHAVFTHAPFNNTLGVSIGSHNDSFLLACQDGPLAAVQGRTWAESRQGVAVFTDLRIGRAGQGFRLVFQSGGLKSAVSHKFGVTLGEVAVALHVVCSPSVETAGVPFHQQPVLDVVDPGGNRMHAQMPQAISAELVAGSSVAAGITGVKSAIIHGDLATFTNLAIDMAGAGWILRFSCKGLDEARTPPFEVQPGAAVALHVQGGHLVQPYSAQALQLSVVSLDRGGNMVRVNASEAEAVTVSADLLGLGSLTREAPCSGAHACLATLDLSIPPGAHLVSAILSISASCTDFDSPFERITSVAVGSHPLKAPAEFNSGPFPGCFRDCSRSAQVIQEYDIVQPICFDGDGARGGLSGVQDVAVCHNVPLLVRWDDQQSTKWDLVDALQELDASAVTLSIEASADVNMGPCNGYLLDALATVRVTYATPEDASLMQGNRQAVSKDGTAVFTDLVINAMGRDLMLGFKARGSGLLPAYSRTFRIGHGPVDKLVLESEPYFGTGNTTLTPSPVVMLIDAAGNRADSSSALVLAQLIVSNGRRPLHAALTGRVRVASKDGLARFTDLFIGIKSDGFNYTILFSVEHAQDTPACNSSSSVCTRPFPVYVGPACCMRVAVRPQTSSGGSAFSPQPALRAYDWGGNEVALTLTNVNVTAKIGINGGIVGAVLGSPTTFVGGWANFTDLSIDKSGSDYTLMFTCPKMISVSSQPFSILVGPAASLTVIRQVSHAHVGKMFGTQPAVMVVDAGGNRVKAWSGDIFASIHQQGTAFHPAMPAVPQANLIGNSSGYVHQGAAYFWNLRLDSMGEGFQLAFSTTGGVSAAVSAPFDVFGGPATGLHLVSAPSVLSNILDNADVAVAALDEDGNVAGLSGVELAFDLVPPSVGSVRLSRPPALNVAKGILSIKGIRVSGDAMQVGWRVTVSSALNLSLQSEALDLLDPLMGWWLLRTRGSVSKLMMKRNLDNLQVRGAISRMSDDSPQAQSLLRSDYGSHVDEQGCLVTSLAYDQFGMRLRTCQTGLLNGTLASKVNLTSSVDASWARDILIIDIQEYVPSVQLQRFVIIANSKNLSSVRQDTVVYRWTGVGLAEYQRLASKGAHDVEHFIFGGLHYLVVANHFDEDGAGYGVASMMYQYKWDDSLQRNTFQPVQALSADGAAACKFFTIEQQSFLVVANYFNGSHATLNSSIYLVERSNPESAVPRLRLAQSIRTNGARDVVHFSDSVNDWIAFANRYDTSVLVHRWMPSTQEFRPAFRLPCSEPVDLETFTANSVVYLVCLSLNYDQLYTGGTAPANGSSVYRYDSSRQIFVRVQGLPTEAGKYLSVFSSGNEVLLSVANVKLMMGDAVPASAHLQAQHRGTTDLFQWNGTMFVPYLTMDTPQGYANAILEVPCTGESLDGLGCGNRHVQRLVLVAQGEATGLETMVLDYLNATRVATHVKTMRVPVPDSQANASIPTIVGSVRNLDLAMPSPASWAGEVLLASSFKWSDPISGPLQVPMPVAARGVTHAALNASGGVAFRELTVVAGGMVSMVLSNEYLNEAMLLSSTPVFYVAPGPPAKLLVYSAAPLLLFSGDVLSAIVLICDAFSNQQPQHTPAVTIIALPNGSASLTVFNESVTTNDGVARFEMPIGGNARMASLEFRAFTSPDSRIRVEMPWARAYSQPLTVLAKSITRTMLPGQVLISSSAVALSHDKLLVFGGLNGSFASNDFRVADLSAFPYSFAAADFSGTLPAARYEHAAVGGLSQNDKELVLVIGGTDGSVTFDDLHKYEHDDSTGSWTNMNIHLGGGGRYSHRAQHARVTSADATTTSPRSVVLVAGGRTPAGDTAAGIVVLGILSSSIRVEDVASDVNNPFTGGELGCCEFMLAWHGEKGYVFGADASGRGRFYVMHVAFDQTTNQFAITWTHEDPGHDSALTLPTSPLFTSAFEFGGQLYFAAMQATAQASAGMYALDLSGGGLKLLDVSMGDSSVLSDGTFSVVTLAAGRVMLVPGLLLRNSSQTSRALLTQGKEALILSVVTAEKLVTKSTASWEAFIGVALSPQPLIHLSSFQGRRARDESGYAQVSAGAYDADTLAPVPLMGQRLLFSTDGVAAFTDLSVAAGGGRVILEFKSPSLYIAKWGPIQMNNGPPAQVVFREAPYGAQPGKPLALQPVVELRDAGGNQVPDDSDTIVSCSLRRSGTLVDVSQYLTGRLIATVSNGVTSFTDLGMTANTPYGVDFQLVVSAAGLASTATPPFHLALPAETSLHLNWTTLSAVCTRPVRDEASACETYKQQASDSRTLIAGMPLADDARLSVTLHSAPTPYDTSAVFTVSVVLASDHSDVVNAMGTVQAAAVGGHVDFTNLRVNLAAQGYKLKCYSPGFPTWYSETFDVVPGAPAGMLVHMQSFSNPSTAAFAVQPVVYVTDAHANEVLVSMEVLASAHSSSGEEIYLLGNTQARTQRGVALFTDLALAPAGVDFVLRFRSYDVCCEAHLNASGSAFNITVGMPYKLAEVRRPTGGRGSEPFAVQPAVSILDAGGNLVTRDTHAVVTVRLARDASLRTYVLEAVSLDRQVTVPSMEHVLVNGSEYIMAAMNYDREADSYDIESVLYRWDVFQERMVQIQSIATQGATFCKHIQHAGQDFMLIANGYQQMQLDSGEQIGTYLTRSHLYRFADGQLELTQSVDTAAPSHATSFKANSSHTFVVVANSFDGESVDVKTDVYLMSENADDPWRLVLQQELSLQAVSVLHAASILMQTYLFVGSLYNTTSHSYTTESQIFTLRDGILEPVQSVTTYGVRKISHWTMDGDETFFALGHSTSKQGSITGGFVAVHAFSGGRLQLAPRQEIGPFNMLSEMQHFSLNGSEFLAITTNPDDDGARLSIYQWDPEGCWLSPEGCSPDFVLSEVQAVRGSESLVYFRVDALARSYFMYATATGFLGIAYRSATYLEGTVSAVSSRGFANFTDLAVNLQQAEYRLSYSSPGLEGASGATFTVLAGDPVALSLLWSLAGSARGGDPFAAQTRIGLVDKGGNLATQVQTQDSGQLVTVTVEDWQDAESLLAPQLRGSSTASVREGVAVFTDLGLDRAGLSVLRFNYSFYRHATQAVLVVPGRARSLAPSQLASFALGGLPFGQQPRLSVLDGGGNFVESDDDADDAPVLVAASLTSRIPPHLAAASLPPASLVSIASSPGLDMEAATLGGQVHLALALSETDSGVYAWSCQGPVLTQTLPSPNLVDLEYLAFDKKMWLLTASADPGMLTVFSKSSAEDDFVMEHRMMIDGLMLVKGMHLGDQPFILVSGQSGPHHGAASNFSRLYSLQVGSQGYLTAVDRGHNVSQGHIIDAHYFQHLYKDYLAVKNESHLTLLVWKGLQAGFRMSQSVEFSGQDVEVTCCDQAGRPIMVAASLARPSFVAVLGQVGPGEIGLESVAAILEQNSASGLPAAVIASRVRYMWQGTRLILCFASADSVSVYIHHKEWIGIRAAEEIALPDRFAATTSRLHASLSLFEADGRAYLLLAGRDQDMPMIELIESGARLSGTTVVAAQKGLVAFTDLSIDLLGAYMLSFRPISLDLVHPSYEALVASGTAMNITVGVGPASRLALSSAPAAGAFPSVSLADSGGNLVSFEDNDVLVSVQATRDKPEEYAHLRKVGSYQVSYPAHVHHLAVNGTHYVAVANSFDGVSYNADSVIMRMTREGQLQGWQFLTTRCAYRFSSFSVTVHKVSRTGTVGEPNTTEYLPSSPQVTTRTDHFLAVANHFDDAGGSGSISYATTSEIYKLKGDAFERFQEIPSLGATKLEPFVIGGVQYLGVANFFDGSSHALESQIWRWDSGLGNFSRWQDIAAVGAHDMEHASSGGKHFLLVAQYRGVDEIELATSSLVFQYSEEAGLFARVAAVETGAARDIEVLALGGVTYFAVASFASQDGGRSKSLLYRLECSDGAHSESLDMRDGFAVRLHQSFDTTGGSSWSHFRRGGLDYLALTNLVDARHSLVVYLWNGSQFNLYTNTTTDAGTVMAGDFFLSADGLCYGVVAMPYDMSVGIYRFENGTGALPDRLGPLAVAEGRVEFPEPYSQGEAYDFDPLPGPLGVLHPVSSGLVPES